MLLFLEQCLNGLQFGLLLFLLAAGLTLVFGIMDLVNLAHGSLYMVGAYFAATFVAWTGSFVAGALLALAASTPASELDAAIAAKKLDKIANDLVAAWYSGMVDGKVVLYTDALVWSAMTYSKPMGICGGVTGYWAEPWTPT